MSFITEQAFFVLKIFKFLGFLVPNILPCHPLLNLLENLIEDKSSGLWCHYLSNQVFKNKLFEILKSKEGLILKLGQFIKYYIGEMFGENVHQKLVPNL